MAGLVVRQNSFEVDFIGMLHVHRDLAMMVVSRDFASGEGGKPGVYNCGDFDMP